MCYCHTFEDSVDIQHELGNAPHLGQPISEATCTLADVREVETIRAWSKVWATTERRSAQGPVKVSRT